MKVFVGTLKGLFVIEKDSDGWRVVPPVFNGLSVYAIGRGAGRWWSAPGSEWTGTDLSWSEDEGRSWHLSEGQIAFPESSGGALRRIWQITEDSDGRLFAGVEPSALFTSDDRGATWSLCEGLWNHPHRPEWQPGFGGQAIHTIAILSKNEWVVGMSTGGVYRTEDGGVTWSPSNKGILAPFMPDPDVEFGQCVHKFAVTPGNTSDMFLQHHWGVYRSNDAGRTWNNVGADKFPSDFGFVCVSNAPKTSFVIPIKADIERVFPEGRMRVFRTTDGGDSWVSLENGLPQSDVYDCVLRDSFHVDGRCLAFGTTGGNLYFSGDNGENWSRIAESLPRISCVRVAA